MSSKPISIVNRPNGIATDYDSLPTLSDSTATYGVRETISHTILVAAGTAMTKTATGSYTYTVTGLTPGVSYQYSISRTYLGATDSTQPRIFTASGATATGYYCTQDDLANAVTTANLAIWTGQDPTAAPDAATVQAALDYADSEIDRLFQMSQYTTSPHLSVTGVSAAVCKEAATWYAVDWLYRSRGDVRDDDSMGNHYAQRVREQTAKLMQYRGGVLQWDAARRWPVSTAPVACC